jgi:23S rRNA pseudouridine955/2504/2580 synthase
MEKTARPAVQWLEISSELAGQRIDNFLLRHLKGVPKSRIYRLLRKGEVRVNRARKGPDYRLQAGDELRIPPVRRAERKPGAPSAAGLERLSSCIVYEDDRLLVLDKPSGMAVHGGSGQRFGVIEGLRALRPKAPFLELVHRLDRDTSGCLMVAKKRSELRAVHELLRSGAVKKKYLLLAWGDWSQGPYDIEAPLKKNQLQGGERLVVVNPEGKQAHTQFRFLDAYPHASMMEAELKTGRTHQIRVHALHAGHPLAGDPKYGDRNWNAILRQQGLKRLFLHAHYVAFQDRERHREIEVSAPLSDDLRKLIQQMERVPDKGAGGRQ